MHAVTYVGQSLYYEKQAVTAAVLFIERCIAVMAYSTALLVCTSSAGLDPILAVRSDCSSVVWLVTTTLQ
jgi:hypothetical protein